MCLAPALDGVASVAQRLKVRPIQRRAALVDWLDVVSDFAWRQPALPFTFCTEWIQLPEQLGQFAPRSGVIERVVGVQTLMRWLGRKPWARFTFVDGRHDSTSFVTSKV